MTAPLSAWASERTLRALAVTTDVPARLAIALGSVRNVIRVIDRSTPAMTVNWASVNDNRSMSFTDFKGGAIHINPKPIMDGRIDHGAALDVCIGFGCHEASHSQESRDRYKYLLKRVDDPSPGAAVRARVDDTTVFNVKTGKPTREIPAFEPMRVAAYLWNIVEDVRVEDVTTDEWPGFGPYFGAVLDYMWDELLLHHELPTEYGPDLADKLKVVFLACRYPAQALKLDSSLMFEIGWWQSWQHEYLSARTDTPTTIRLGLEHLMEDFSTMEEMRNMAREEQAERERGEELRAQLRRLVREGIPGSYEVCINDGGELVPLDEATADLVNQLVREGLIELRTIVPATGAANPPIRVRKPEEDDRSKKSYIGTPDAASAALRTALVFRNSAPRHDLKLLKEGTIDDEELYRWGMGDHRVFSEKVIEAKPDVFMGLLVDLSGSMRSKLHIAQRLAQLFVWALHDQEGVQTEVWGHTADDDVEPTSSVYRLWEQGDPMSRLGLISTLPHCNNADGAALSYVVKEVSKVEQPQKVVVVLSDGLPSATDYGGKPAMNHVRTVVGWASNLGVEVWQIAIDPNNLRPADQELMYPGRWFPYVDEASLPRQLTQLMSRHL